MKKVLIRLRDMSPWKALLEEYFSEVEITPMDGDDGATLQKTDLILAEPDFFSMSFLQKVRSAKSLNPLLRVICLGEPARSEPGVFDFVFKEPCDLFEFSQKICGVYPLPDSVRLLIADDDAEILAMLSGYFEGRHAPSFEVIRAANGKEALDAITAKRPQALILDLKMPLMKGSELYVKLQKQGLKIPTIIFFDAISAADLDLVKKAGNPVVVEKGYRESSLPYLMAVVKKLVYFAGC